MADCTVLSPSFLSIMAALAWFGVRLEFFVSITFAKGFLLGFTDFQPEIAVLFDPSLLILAVPLVLVLLVFLIAISVLVAVLFVISESLVLALLLLNKTED
jgi:hypothetical protein